MKRFKFRLALRLSRLIHKVESLETKLKELVLQI